MLTCPMLCYTWHIPCTVLGTNEIGKREQTVAFFAIDYHQHTHIHLCTECNIVENLTPQVAWLDVCMDAEWTAWKTAYLD